MRGAHRVLLSGVTAWLTSWYSACVDWKTLVGWHQLLVETIGPARQSLGGFMRGKRMPCIRAAASIAVGIISGAGAAVPGSIAGLYIARACLPGPISGEIVMGLLFLGWVGRSDVRFAVRNDRVVQLFCCRAAWMGAECDTRRCRRRLGQPPYSTGC